MVGAFKGAIVAAGRGERLRAAVRGIPKPLVEIGGEALLTRQVRALIELGARPVVAIVNAETARLIGRHALGLGAECELCVRDTANSMESLLALGERLGECHFMLATVDAVMRRAELERFAARALELTAPSAERPADGVLGVVRWRGDRRPLFADVAADGAIRSLGADQTPLVTAGIYFFSTRIFKLADAARAAGLDAMRRFFGLLIDRGMRLMAIELEGVVDVDEAADLDAARRVLESEACEAGVVRPGSAGRSRG